MCSDESIQFAPDRRRPQNLGDKSLTQKQVKLPPYVVDSTTMGKAVVATTLWQILPPPLAGLAIMLH